MSSQDRIPTTKIIAPTSSQMYERILPKLDTLHTAMVQMKSDVAEMAAKLEELDTRVSRTSYRATAESKTNEEQNAVIAMLASKLDSVVTKQDQQGVMLEKLVLVTNHPLVKDIARVLATAFLTWMATKGFR